MKRTELKDTLELVSLALADTNIVPIFQCFCFKHDHVLAYNDQICITADALFEQEFAVHGKTLLGLLKNSSAENLTIRTEETSLIIKADRSTFKLPFFPSSDFIFEDPWADENILYLDLSQDVFDALKACLTTTSNDQAQPALMGISIVNLRTLYSCNGDALTKVTLNVTGDEGSFTFFMPNTFCKTVVQIAEATGSKTGTLGFIDDEWVFADFKDNKYTVYGRLLKNANPIDFEALIERTVKGEVAYTNVPEGLNEALSRARIVGDAETAPTVFTVEGKRLKLVTDARAGVVHDSLSMDHPDVVGVFSAEMVQGTIALCDQISVMKNCLVARKGEKVFQLLSSMDNSK